MCNLEKKYSHYININSKKKIPFLIKNTIINMSHTMEFKNNFVCIKFAYVV